MRVRCLFSLPVYIGILFLHGLSLMALLVSAVPLGMGVLMAMAVLCSAARAHSAFSENSLQRVRWIVLADQWAELEDQQRSWRLRLPRVEYLSEFLIVLYFRPLDTQSDRPFCIGRSLVLFPAMLSPADNCDLRRHLHYALVSSD